jgi:hypothetical protein
MLACMRGKSLTGKLRIAVAIAACVAMLASAPGASAGVVTFSGEADTYKILPVNADTQITYDADGFTFATASGTYGTTQSDFDLGGGGAYGFQGFPLADYGTLTMSFLDQSQWVTDASDDNWALGFRFYLSAIDSGDMIGIVDMMVNPRGLAGVPGVNSQLWDEGWALLTKVTDYSLTPAPTPPTKYRFTVDATAITYSYFNGSTWVDWPTRFPLADIATLVGTSADNINVNLVQLLGYYGSSVTFDSLVAEGGHFPDINEREPEPPNGAEMPVAGFAGLAALSGILVAAGAVASRQRR